MFIKPYLFWLSGKYIGGAERYALNLALKMSTNGIEVVILCPYIECYNNVNDILRAHFLHSNFSIRVIYCSAPSSSRFWKLPVVRTIYLYIWTHSYSNLLSKIDPKAVHIIQPFPTRSFTFIKAAVAKLYPVTITFQLVPCPATLTRRYQQLYKSIHPYAILTAVSKSNQASLAKAINISPACIRYIPNRPAPCSGLLSSDQKQSILKDLNLSNYHFICSTVAALVPRKGHEDIIYACELLITKSIFPHFLFIGSGSYEHHLKDLARAKGVSDYIHFLGNRNDVDSLLQLTNVFIFPSSAEGLSFALMEAVQRKVPLIASNSCGADDFLIPGVHYRAYEPGDSDQLQFEIKQVMSNLADATNSAQLAAIALNEYSYDDMYNDTLKLAMRS